jgi:hypothetical protein
MLAAQTPSALESSPQGWQDITPDATLKGWTRVSIPPDKPLPPVSQWTAGSGLLICDGTGGHDWLRYDREFKDFIFHVEFRYAKVEGNPRYNSGIFVRNDAEGRIWHQAQIGSLSGGYLFGVSSANGSPQRFNLSKEMKESRVKEAGEWNTIEVRAQGRSLSVWANGATVSEYSACEVPQGYVGLEAEGFRIEFRNLKIKELK